uniref:SCAN box domain-containing protein n=1 Tax=Knipowitschia caucasica TaxID=637954 RepID=A0AAV2KWG7_KNICA
MASRKKSVRLPKRTGLRSQSHVQQPGGAGAAWETEDEEEKPEVKPGPFSEPGQDMVMLMREFLAGQQRREEGLLVELRRLGNAQSNPPGKALEAYSAMDEERAHCYRDLKEALLAKFDISPETYRQQFRAIIMEQLLRVFPFEVRTWVKEREPGDGLTAAKLAVQYLNARKGGPARTGTTAQRGPAQPLLSRPPRQDSYPDRQDQPYLVSVGVVENLPVDAILGWDLPVLMDLLNEKVSEESDSGGNSNCSMSMACPVLTRAQAKTGVQPLPDLDSSLCEGGTKGPKKSRRQRRFEKQMWSASPEDVLPLCWNVPDNVGGQGYKELSGTGEVCH